MDEKEAQDDFDKLVRSGETLKVSLTPGRLKSFEVTMPMHLPSSEL